MGNGSRSGKQVWSQASYRVTWQLAWIQTVCISIKSANKMSAKCLFYYYFQAASKSFKVGENIVSVKQLGSGWDAKLLGVSSRSKLFANGTTVAIRRIRVNSQPDIPRKPDHFRTTLFFLGKAAWNSSFSMDLMPFHLFLLVERSQEFVLSVWCEGDYLPLYISLYIVW